MPALTKMLAVLILVLYLLNRNECFCMPMHPSKPVNLKIQHISTHEGNFSWTPSADLIAPNYYTICYEKNGELKDIQTAYNNITLKDLTPSTTYGICIYACNLVEDVERCSDGLCTESTTNSNKPKPPENFKCLWITNHKVRLEWTQPQGDIPVHHYVISKTSNLGLSTESTIEKQTTSRNFTFTSLNINETYRFTLLAANLGTGDEITSEEVVIDVFTRDKRNLSHGVRSKVDTCTENTNDVSTIDSSESSTGHHAYIIGGIVVFVLPVMLAVLYAKLKKERVNESTNETESRRTESLLPHEPILAVQDTRETSRQLLLGESGQANYTEPISGNKNVNITENHYRAENFIMVVNSTSASATDN